MGGPGGAGPPASPDGSEGPCPSCGGRLGPPVSGDVHCYVDCAECGERFPLDDPRLTRGFSAPADG